MNRYRCWEDGWGNVHEIAAINPLAAARRYARLERAKGRRIVIVYNLDTDDFERVVLHVSRLKRWFYG